MPKIFRNAHQAGRWAPGSVAAIGKFDGLHRGHHKLISAAVSRARELATRALVVTFDPTPQEYFRPGSYEPLLSPARFRRLLGQMGVDAVLYLPFNRSLACLAPGGFARDILANALKVMEVFVGENFCFGKDRAGKVDDLSDLGREHGFLVRPIPMLRVGGEKISTSLIRRLLAEGRRSEAETYLGRSVA